VDRYQFGLGAPVRPPLRAIPIQPSRQADRRSHLGLQVNLLAEQESTETLRLVKQVAERLGVNTARADGTLEQETDLPHRLRH
jgi:uncharacterized membrane protein